MRPAAACALRRRADRRGGRGADGRDPRLAARHRARRRAGATTEQALLSYVEEELLDALTDAERRQPLDASVVEELTPELLEPLGLPGDFVSSAAAELLLLRPVPGRTGATAFHPLLRAFLRDRWRAERTPPQQAELLARVAGPLAAAGHSTEAIAAALDAGRWDQALRFVAQDAQALLQVAPETVRAWLRRLPASARDAPLARLFEARLALAEGQPAEAARLLDGAIPALDAESAEAGWAGRLALAEGRYWSGQIDAFGELAGDVDAALDERPAPHVEATGWLTANALAAAGATAAAERLIARLLEAGAEGNAAYLGWTGLYLRAPAGESGAVLAEIEPHLAGATHDDYLRRRDLLLPLAIFLLSMEGRHDEAAILGTRYARVSEALGCRPDMQQLADLTRGWQLALAGRLDEAEAALRTITGPQPATWASICHPVAMATLAHGRGRHAEAATWAERGLALAAQAPAVIAADALPPLAQALAPTAPARAQLVLSATLERLDATLPGPAGSFPRARLIAARACLRHAAGAPPDACAHDLCRALGEAGAAHEEFVRVEWSRLRRPLWELLAAGMLDPALALRSLERALPDELLPFADHPSPAVRVTVAEALGRSGHGEADDRLAQLLGDGDPAVADAASAARLRAVADPPARSFRLLGGFALTRGGWPVPERAWERPLAQRLVRFLLLQEGAPVPEEALLEAFWPGRAARSARAVLQVNLSRARTVLDPPNARRSAILSSERTYRLVLDDRDDVDTRTYLQVAAAALATTGPRRRDALAAAARLWSGEPLPEERYADWAQPWRERLLRTHRELLVVLLDAHVAAGDQAAALEVGHSALVLEPHDERVHRELMRAYARSGLRGRALRQYLACRRALVDELGVEPGEETAALHRRLLAGETV